MTNEYKYTLSQDWIDKVKHMVEFANGGTQVSVKLKSGKVIKRVLISNCKWIIAVRGFSDLPFSLESINEIYQTEEDKSPAKKGGWKFFGLPSSVERYRKK